MRIFENEYDRIEISEDLIPTWAKWLAVDEDGEVWVYEYAPKSEVQDDTGMWFEYSEDWKKSLREVADPPEPKIVSLKNVDKYKKVKYFGEEFNVLEKVKYIATDRNGEIYGFGEGEVKINMEDGVFLSTSTVGRRLGVLKLVNPADWYKTLREV